MVDVESIKANHNIVTTIENLTGEQVTKHKIRCPFHEDETPSLHVYEDGGWKCWGCGLHGDVIAFLGYYYFGTQYDPETHFLEIIDRIGALDIKPLPQHTTKPRPKPQRPKQPFGVSLDAIMQWHDNMPAQRREYWYSRGLNDQTISEFFLGWDGKRYTIPALYRLQPFGVKRRQSDIDDGIAAKYTQITGGRVGIFNADCLWTATKCIICEGEIDAMLLHQLGYHAVSSTGGAGSWKVDWAKHFTHVRELVILYDNDAAGVEGANKVRQSMRRAKIATLPEGIKDVGELWTTGDAAQWLKENV